MIYVFYCLLGYLSGSILYAKVFGYLFKQGDIVKKSKDQNPGTANAFMQGGFLCGVCTLCGDMLKGFGPVYMCMQAERMHEPSELGMALVIAAPVIGHIFPVFFRFKGGKGIATTFGCLLGMLPNIFAAGVLAFFFIFLSVLVRVTPHLMRTIGTFLLTAVTLCFSKERLAIRAGFFIITVLVSLKLYHSKEEREKCKVRLLWMH